MKKLLILFVLIAAPLLSAKADPAKKVNLSFRDQKLKVEILHHVKDVKTHYIDQVIINVDGKDVKIISLKSQSSQDSENLELQIPEISAGSKVVVKTRCNEFGLKSGKLMVE